MKTRIKILLSLSLNVGALTCVGAALADSDANAALDHSGAGYSYEFEDDRLLGDQLAPFGDHLRFPIRAERVLLIRPRVHFVPEMLKSVESL